jgi:hypothetical protein
LDVRRVPGSAAERAAAEAAAAAELELLHAELATENSYPSEQARAAASAHALRCSPLHVGAPLSHCVR